MKKSKQALIHSVIALLLCVSMFVGTTFAWFTDSVTSMKNIIQAGNLDIDLEYMDADGKWRPVNQNTNVFDEDALWEPGHTEVVYLRVINKGSLALKYQLGVNVESETPGTNVAGDQFKLSDYIKMGAVEGVSTAYATRDDARKAVTTSGTLASGYVTYGKMLANDPEQYIALVVYMPEEVDNAANYRGNAVPTIHLGINLLATQLSAEEDSFGSDYDENAQFPLINGEFAASVPLPAVDANNQTTEDVNIGYATDKMSAEIPAGVQVESGAQSLDMTVKTTERSSNISMKTGQLSRSLDVHIDGISKDNKVPMTIHLGSILPIGMSDANVQLYHVEDGKAILMEKVDTFTAHNQYTYDATTGEVSIYIASFSEVTAVIAAGDPWTGEIDGNWYNATKGDYESSGSFTIEDEEDLAAFGKLVGEGYTFEDKSVYLTANLNMAAVNGTIFYPIGYKNSNGNYEKAPGETITSDLYSFEGVFDGGIYENGTLVGRYTISNIYQNTWDMVGDYNSGYSGTPNYYKDGMGLFGYVLNGTVKNLNVDNFSSDGEFTPTGVIAAYAVNSTFDNIRITNSNPRVYNTGNGGIVGIGGSEDDTANMSLTFTNIQVDNSNTISALWGSWDVGCGGVIGMFRGAGKVSMTNCEIGAVIDVYNDVCGNYQYYQYRYSGMLIGTVGGDGDPANEAQNFKFENVTVYIGDWADYYYCEFEKNSGASYTEDFQFSRVERDEIVFDQYNMPTGCTHEHTANEDKLALYLPFNQLYTGYGWGASPKIEHTGVKVVNYFYMITYKDGDNVIGVEYMDKGQSDDTHNVANEFVIEKEYSVAGKTFTGWVNTGSQKVSNIAAGNRNDIILYATYLNEYTARWVDEDGNVIHTEKITKNTRYQNLAVPANPESDADVLIFDHWEVKNADGTYTALQDYKFSSVEGDITIYPYFNIKDGGLGLTPVDTDGDGRADYYTIEAVSANNIGKDVNIPGNVNGVPVKVITDLSGGWTSSVENVVIQEGVEEINSRAFGDTQNLKTVELPSTITKIENSAFAGYLSNVGSLVGYEKILTITYNGTKADWDAVVANSNQGNSQWEDGLAEGTTVVCTDGTYTLTDKRFNWGFIYTWTWTPNE